MERIVEERMSRDNNNIPIGVDGNYSTIFMTVMQFTSSKLHMQFA